MTKEMQGMEQATTEGQESEKPLLCVSLLGEFRLDWHVTPATKEALWNSRTAARALFKLLLCAPGRQASRSQLAGILWPESDEAKARESLRQARNVLRKMLRAADGTELLEPSSGNSETLKLADQARLWVDADAFEEYVSQASRATSADEALPLFQQAQALLVGEFLADDQSVEWARHRWVKQRRQALLLARGRMVRHLADLYLTQGQISLAEEVLERHLTRFPTDQDALYRLLVLLEQQECFEEARLLYERSRRTLEALGKQLAPHVRACNERYQHALFSRIPANSSQASDPQLMQASETAKHAPLLVSPVPLQRQLPSGAAFSNGALAQTTRKLGVLLEAGESLETTWEVLHVLFESKKEDGQNMSLLSRRQLLALGIAAFITRLAQLDSTRISAVEREEVGRALGQSIADGWKLFHTAGNAEVQAIGQVQLSLIHQAHALLHPTVRSFLYAGAYGLLGSALHMQARDEEALHAYHHAHLAAIATGDPWYIAQNLICQADAYQALGRSAETFQLLEEALGYLGHSEEEHRRTRAHLLGCWANAALTMGNYSLAQHKLDESAMYLEQVSASEEFDSGSWLHLAGKQAFVTRNYSTAIAYFERAYTETPAEWTIRRILVLLPLMASFACEGNPDACAAAAETASSALSVLGAPSLNRIYTTTLQEILKAFPHDDHLRSLMRGAQQHLTQ